MAVNLTKKQVVREYTPEHLMTEEESISELHSHASRRASDTKNIDNRQASVNQQKDSDVTVGDEEFKVSSWPYFSRLSKRTLAKALILAVGGVLFTVLGQVMKDVDISVFADSEYFEFIQSTFSLLLSTFRIGGILWIIVSIVHLIAGLIWRLE